MTECFLFMRHYERSEVIQKIKHWLWIATLPLVARNDEENVSNI